MRPYADCLVSTAACQCCSWGFVSEDQHGVHVEVVLYCTKKPRSHSEKQTTLASDAWLRFSLNKRARSAARFFHTSLFWDRSAFALHCTGFCKSWEHDACLMVTKQGSRPDLYGPSALAALAMLPCASQKHQQAPQSTF